MPNREQASKLFSERFRFFLEHSKHSETEIANKLDVSMATTYAWRVGRKLPRFELFLAICKFFKVTPDEFLGIQDVKKPRLKDLKSVNEHWAVMTAGAREAIVTITNLSTGVAK